MMPFLQIQKMKKGAGKIERKVLIQVSFENT